MGIEERISILEEKLRQISANNPIQQNDQWVTPKELSEIMNCSLNNIYIKIRSGEIYGTRKFGSILRIPMSQFYKSDEAAIEIEKPLRELSIKEKVFGNVS